MSGSHLLSGGLQNKAVNSTFRELKRKLLPVLANQGREGLGVYFEGAGRSKGVFGAWRRGLVADFEKRIGG